MGLCFTCDQPTQPQIEVNVPTTEENNQNSYKLIITQRNRKRVNDSFAPAEQNDDYSTCRDYSNWFDEF